MLRDAIAQSDMVTRSVADTMTSFIGSAGAQEWLRAAANDGLGQFLARDAALGSVVLPNIFNGIQSMPSSQLASQIQQFRAALPESWLALELPPAPRKRARRVAKAAASKTPTVEGLLTEILAELRSESKISLSAARAAWLAVLLVLLQWAVTLSHQSPTDSQVSTKAATHVQAQQSIKSAKPISRGKAHKKHPPKKKAARRGQSIIST